MSKMAQKQLLAETLERIQSLFSELRQTEALESQVHEMVVMKRHRLDALMTDYLELAHAGAEAAPVVAVPAVVAIPAIAAIEEIAVEAMPMTPIGNYGAPKDLLKGRPTPSAQHVLDSLNRLMTGIKDISAKSAAAA